MMNTGSSTQGGMATGPRPEIVFDTKYCVSQLNRENPKEVVVTDKNIYRIGNLCDVPAFNKLNISFNRLITTLDGVEQMPQLKELWCFACSVRELTGLGALTKAETIYLQNNRIDSMFDAFKTLTKLRDLRLDSNRITKVESLQNCQALRKLDLSHNALQSIDGLSGLQSLQELKLSHNNIRTIASLKGLPSLTEIDVSHNHLKSLDGIQHFLKLEIVRANHNHMVHLTFAPYSSNNSAAQGVKGDNSTPLNTGRSGKSIAGGRPPKNDSNSKATVLAAAVALPSLDRPVLSEIYLKGNKIRTIVGLDMYAHSLEILDISHNQIVDVLNILSSLKGIAGLHEVYFYGNPCVEDGTQMQALRNVLSANCRQLTVTYDEMTILPPKEASVEDILGSMEDGDGEGNGLDTMSLASKEFHTWNDESGSTVLHNEAEEKEKAAKEATEEEDEKEEDDEINKLFHAPKLTLKSMLTQEQIEQRAAAFRNFLQQTQDNLNATVFQFLYPDGQPLGTAEAIAKEQALDAQRARELARRRREASLAEITGSSWASTEAAAKGIEEEAKPEPREEAKEALASKLISAMDRALVNNNNNSTVSKPVISMPKHTTMNIPDPKQRRKEIEKDADTSIAQPKRGALAQNASASALVPADISDANTSTTSTSNITSQGKSSQRRDQKASAESDAQSVQSSGSSKTTNNNNRNDPYFAKKSLQKTPASSSSNSISGSFTAKLHAQILQSATTGMDSSPQHTTATSSSSTSTAVLNVDQLLSSGVNAHGSKLFQSKVEEDSRQMTRQQLAQMMTGRSLTATSTGSTSVMAAKESDADELVNVKISKVKPERRLFLADHNQSQSHGTAEETFVNDKDTNVNADEQSDNPLQLSSAERQALQRAVSERSMLLSSAVSAIEVINEAADEDELNDDGVEDVSPLASARSQQSMLTEDLLRSQRQTTLVFQPRSIGFDRRVLNAAEDDLLSVGSAPLPLPQQSLSLYTQQPQQQLSQQQSASSAASAASLLSPRDLSLTPRGNVPHMSRFLHFSWATFMTRSFVKYFVPSS